jgi:hypothetical protein
VAIRYDDDLFGYGTITNIASSYIGNPSAAAVRLCNDSKSAPMFAAIERHEVSYLILRLSNMLTMVCTNRYYVRYWISPNWIRP